MTGNVLVDSEAFMESLSHQISGAESRIYIQVLTFEGDRAGRRLIDLLKRSDVPDIRLCIDSYTKAVINDRFVFGIEYLRNPKFREEIKNTGQLVKEAEAHGISVKFTNPLGPLLIKYPFRNHKKLIVIDDNISYIGGINFSEHNFEWHDMMIRIEDEGIGAALSKDFIKTWNNEPRSTVCSFDDTDIYSMNGYNSASLYDRLFETIASAQKEIVLFSPYVSNPLLDILKNELASSVEVHIISPKTNNKSIFKKLLIHEAQKETFNLHLYQHNMSHLKAILIDRTRLITGSSNFDFVSYFFEQEIIFSTENKNIVQDFIEKVLKPDLKRSKKLNSSKKYYLASALIAMGYNMIRKFYKIMSIR